jgi:hypothetical protein
MNRALRSHNATEGGLRARPIRSSLPKLDKCGRYAKHRGRADRAVLESKQGTKIGVADADRVGQHGPKYQIQLSRRVADSAQHLRGCYLLFQRIVQLAGKCPDLLFKGGVVVL